MSTINKASLDLSFIINTELPYAQESKEYEELIRRVPNHEKTLLERKLLRLTNKESSIRMLHEALETQNWDHEIFQNEDFPYYALEAVGLEEGDKNKLSPSQFATIMIYWKALQDHGRSVQPVSLFHANGSINLQAKDLIKQTLRLIIESLSFFTIIPLNEKDAEKLKDALEANPENALKILEETTKSITPIYLLSNEQLEELFQEMSKLPKSEQQFFVVPDKGEYNPSILGALPPLKRTIRQALYYDVGFNVFSRLEHGKRMIPSFGLTQAFLYVKFASDAVKMNPVLALSSAEDIYENGINGERDYALHFPGIELPIKADLLLAPEDEFRYHDFYHAYLTSCGPRTIRPCSLQAAYIIDHFFLVPGRRDYEGIKALRDTFINMELAKFRYELQTSHSNINDLFWSQIESEFIVNQPPISPGIAEETEMKIAAAIGWELPLMEEILEGPKNAYLESMKRTDKILEALKAQQDKLPESEYKLKIMPQISNFERQKRLSLLNIIDNIWQERIKSAMESTSESPLSPIQNDT